MRIRGMLVLLLGLLASYSFAQNEEIDVPDLVQPAQGNTSSKKGKMTVAILNFYNIDGQSSVLGRYFSEECARYWSKTIPGWQLVERSQIQQLQREWDLSGSGLVNEDRAIELGELLGADAVVLGTLTRIGRRIAVHMRVVDTRTAAVLSTGTTELNESKYIRMYNDILK